MLTAIILRPLRILRLAIAYRRDRGLAYDWSRAFRAARRHA
jgi:hypothetical protein